MEDSGIIALYWQRNENAIAETDRKYGPYCMTVAGAILPQREDAEECVSDTWFRAWNSMPPQRPNCLRLFLARITRNLAFDRWRAKNADRRGGGELALALDELSQCVAGSQDTESQAEARELEACIRRFLAGLPQRDRDIFLRRYFYVESVKSIARRYGMKEGTAAVSLHRCRQKLRAHLEKEGYIL